MCKYQECPNCKIKKHWDCDSLFIDCPNKIYKLCDDCYEKVDKCLNCDEEINSQDGSSEYLEFIGYWMSGIQVCASCTRKIVKDYVQKNLS